MKKLLLILAGILLSVQGYCGESVKWPHTDVWPESPTARAFREVAFSAPSMLTGAVEFKVPLYNLDVEGLNLGFSLDYRSNGIRVDADPAPVGYGWVFNPAFRITRQIMGRPDEYFPFVGDDALSTFDYTKCYRSITDSGTNNSAQVISGVRPRYDTEHDIFTIHMPGRALTAIYNKGKFVTTGCGDYRIEGFGRLDSIRVTDPRGRIFSFAQRGERSRSEISYVEWLLTSIELPSGKKIKFTWELLEVSGRMTYLPAGYNLTYSNTSIYPVGWKHPEGDRNTVLESEFQERRYLSKIEFPGGVIDFTYMAQSVMFLTKMEVKWGNSEVWNATLQYGTGDDKGLLKKVSVKGEGDYGFEYDPHRLSKFGGRDWFGYCNGPYQSALHPKVRFKDAWGIQETEVLGADREIDEDMMKANLLVKANYPTGGSVEWEYETHRFAPQNNNTESCDYFIYNNKLSAGGGLRVKKIIMKESPDDSNPIIRTYQYGKNGNGLANVVAVPTLSTFIKHGTHIIFDYAYQCGRPWIELGLLMINVHSDYLKYQINSIPIWYSEVAEHTAQGVTKVYFEDITEPNNISYGWSANAPHSIYSVFSKGPQQVKREVYKVGDGDTAKVTTETWEYESSYGGTYKNVCINRNKYQFMSPTPEVCPDFGIDDGLTIGRVVPETWAPNFPDGGMQIADFAQYIYSPNQYSIDSYREINTSHKITEHHDNGDVTMTENYEYVYDTETVKSITRTTSDGRTVVSTTDYPSSSGTAIERQMVSENVVDIPIRTVTTKGTSSQTVEYHMKRVGKRVFAPGSIEIWRDASAKMWGGSYDYDNRGNLTHRLSADSVTTRWIWNYYGRYPLKQILGDRLVSEAQWKPLVGPVALKTPNGITSHFDYDSAGRLIRTGISMQGSKGTGNGSVMTEYEYKIGDSDNRLVTKTYIDRYNPLRNIANHDGLGRQVSAVTEFPEGRVADATAYNAMGLPERQWSRVPVSADRPSLSDIATAASTHYRDTVPYALTEYEPSPRGTVTATVRAGASWHSNGKKMTVARHTNVAPSYTCYKWRADADGVTLEGLYPDRTLTVERVTDEEGIAVTTFTDSEGHMLSRRTGAGTTYYVYDDYGDLRYILPPGIYGSRKRTDDVMQQLAYWYDYDSHGHCVLKKLPGAEARQYRYDPAGRLVAETGPDYTSGTWQVYLFDGLGRPALTATGSFTSANVTKFASLVRKVALTGSSKAVGRTGYEVITPKTVLPRGATYTATYYDDYDFITHLNLGNYFEKDTVTSLTGGLSAVIPGQQNPNRVFAADGLVTGIYTGDGYEAIYYDGYGRECQRVGTGYNAGRHYMTYDIYGSLLRERFMSGEGSDAPQRDVIYSYDRAGRLLSTKVIMNGHTAEIIPAYDRIGNVSSMRYGTAISRRLAYDLHGWLKRSDCGSNTTSSRIYGETLAYKYNGYLSSKTITSTGKYTYSYDTSGRLVKAAWSGIGGADYSSTYSYDPRGNITAMKRWGMTDRLPDGTGEFGLLDDITATYSGNRLTGLAVESGAVAFEGISGYGRDVDATLEYDRAGRLTRDPSRGITQVTYNRHGLPEWTYFDDGHATLDTYDGLGRHMATKRYTMETQVFGEHETQVPVYQSTRSYTGDGVICEDGKWRIARFAGGYFTPDPLVVKPMNPGLLKTAANVREIPDTLSIAVLAKLGGAHYYITDHQGNNVAVADSTGRVEQRTDYYPYGTQWANSATHPFLYSGKEWLAAHGLNEYDFDARRYAPLIPRFTTLDPLCEKRPWESPYLYCGANPVNAIDPTGKDYYHLNSYGNIEFLETTNDEYDVITTDVKDAEPLQVNKEVMQSKKSRTVKYGTGENEAEVDTYSGDDSLDDFFDFVISNSDVEWSKIKLETASGEYQTIVGTTHDAGGDLSQDVVRSDAINNGSNFIEAFHCHPSLSEIVSGGDVEVAKKVIRDFPGAKFYIVFPNYSSKEAVEYNENTLPGVLPEIEVIHRK